jgi:hypothetical protein
MPAPVNAPHAMTVTIAKAILVVDNFERWVIFRHSLSAYP